MKLTRSVKQILDAFEKEKSAFTVVELADRLEGQMNRTTVYRILNRLENEKLIHSFTGKDGKKWYVKELRSNAFNEIEIHPHFQCKQCGSIEILGIEVPLPEISTTQIEAISLLVIGNCQSCNS